MVFVRVCLAVLCGIATLHWHEVLAQPQLTADQHDRIKIGINLIKLGCGTATSDTKTEVSGHTDASLTLKAPPGLSAGGEVTYTTEEAQGLAALLSKTVNSDTVGLSQQQLVCMRPYVKRIFDVLFPISHSESAAPEDGTGDRPPVPALPAGVRTCPVTTDPGTYFAVSLDGTKQNLSGWFPADKCVRLANDPNIRAVYIAAVGFFNGSYSGVTQSGESVALPVCVEGTDSDGLQQYTKLGPFSLRDGHWRRKCMLKKDTMDYYRVRVGRSNEIVRVDAAD